MYLFIFIVMASEFNLFKDDSITDCYQVVKKDCPSMNKDCLAKNLNKFKDKCNFLWQDLMPPHADELYINCNDDLNKHCKNINDIDKCLKENRSKFSKKCQEVLSVIGDDKIKKVKDACREELKNNCDNQDMVACLSKIKISEACRKELFN